MSKRFIHTGLRTIAFTLLFISIIHQKDYSEEANTIGVFALLYLIDPILKGISEYFNNK